MKTIHKSMIDLVKPMYACEHVEFEVMQTQEEKYRVLMKYESQYKFALL